MEKILAALATRMDLPTGRAEPLQLQLDTLSQVVRQNRQRAVQKQLLELLCARLDLESTELLAQAIARSNLRVPALFAELPRDGQPVSAEWVDYEVLPELERLINDTAKACK